MRTQLLLLDSGGRGLAWRARRVVACALALAAGVLFVGVGSAFGAVAGPGWSVDSMSAPTNFGVIEGGSYEVEVTNAGSEASWEVEPGTSNLTPVVITDEVPAALTVGTVTDPGCSVSGQVVRCVYEGSLAPDRSLHFAIPVSVASPSASGPITNVVSVSGGGAKPVSTSSTSEISSLPPAFGPSRFSFAIDGLNGAPDTQAGDHPYELTTTIDLNSVVSKNVKELGSVITGVHDLKDVVVDLPLGFAGSALAAPQCTLAELSSAKLSEHVRGEVLPGTGCPPDTTVGHLRSEPLGTESAESPIWNITPEQGEPAEFGFIDLHENTHVFYTHVVPSPQGYMLQVTSRELPQIIVSHIVVSFYGDPALRDGTGGSQIPFLTNPTACDGEPLTATLYMDSWQDPASFNADGTPDLANPNWVKASSSSPPVTGCDELQFTPSLFAQPTTSQADSPSGLEFELKIPQSEDIGVNATPAMRSATVTLPEGVTVDPSAGSGLAACSEAQIGWEGGSVFDFNTAPPACPEASKVASLEIETPLIRSVLHGEVYLANQNKNPFGSVFAAYVVVNDPVTGVLLKIPGEVETNPQTGQITASFAESPQLPFSDLKLHFNGGSRGTLATPDGCATYTTTSVLTPWSAPESGLAATPFDSFAIDAGCVGAFAPTFTAGSSSLQAGGYTPFVASLERQDTDQELAGVTVSLPPGLSANIASVPLCPEAQANSGTCPESTQIGTVQAEAGPGTTPLSVEGKAYLTGPYNGGPYGLSVVVPAVAGPYNFGDVIVRQSLRIDPRDSHVTDVSNPFPTILDPTGPNGQTDGIPIKVRRVNVNINRPGFTLNPTSCAKLPLSASISSTQGATATQSTPFQLNGCASLKFTPKIVASASGHASKADGASLSVKISYPKGALGTQSWFSETKLIFPIQLPARLTTIQKACLAAVFETNPAACPAAATIGHATVRTPILPAPLTGPIYFVSYGSAKFPEAVMVLQGNGITIDLHGETYIAHPSGLTSATFRNLPDTPFETFEATIPQGRYSEFGTNLPARDGYNLCSQKLIMPTSLKAQNGLELNQTTKVTTTGCTKPKTTHKKHTDTKHK